MTTLDFFHARDFESRHVLCFANQPPGNAQKVSIFGLENLDKASLKRNKLLTRSDRYSEFIIMTSNHTKSNKEMLMFGAKYLQHYKMSVERGTYTPTELIANNAYIRFKRNKTKVKLHEANKITSAFRKWKQCYFLATCSCV